MKNKSSIKINNLASTHPELAKEWHPTKNGDLKLSDFTAGSNKKAWWMCNKGHEWLATISHRVNGRGCPYCSNRKVLTGFNDLATTHPELAKQWHPTKNGDLKSTNVTFGSSKKVWWKCKKGHEWETTVNNRSIDVSCPYCLGHKVLTGFNDLATLNPQLTSEWNFNKNGDLKPSDVTPYSNKKVWWKCEKGHEWKASIYARSRGMGCPYCSNHRILVDFNDLTTTNPELAKQWHPTKNGDLKPTKVTFGSSKKVWWQCKHGHEWEAVIKNRSKGSKCPYCSKENL